MNDAPVTELLIQASIKTENHLMAFSGSSWQDCPDNGRSTGAYIIFHQGEIIDHSTHVPVPVSHSIEKIEYNTACTAGMALANFINVNSWIIEQGSRHISIGSSFDCLG